MSAVFRRKSLFDIVSHKQAHLWSTPRCCFNVRLVGMKLYERIGLQCVVNLRWFSIDRSPGINASLATLQKIPSWKQTEKCDSKGDIFWQPKNIWWILLSGSHGTFLCPFLSQNGHKQTSRVSSRGTGHTQDNNMDSPGLFGIEIGFPGRDE